MELRAGDRVRPQRFRLPHQQHPQRLARPLPRRGLRAGRRRHPGHGRRPGIPNQQDFFAGRVLREEWITALNIAKPVELGLPNPVNLAFGTAFRRERYAIRQGELASYVNGGSIRSAAGGQCAPGGSQSFPGFAPGDATDRHRNNFSLYADAETNLSEKVLTEVAARFEDYSDFGSNVSFKGSVRYQPSRRVTLRAGGQHRVPGAGPEPGFLQQGGDQRHRRRVHRRRALSRRQPGGPGAGRGAAQGGNGVQPERGGRAHAGRELHRHRRLLPHPDQRPDPARRDLRRRRDAATSSPRPGSATSAGSSTSPTASTPAPRASTSRPAIGSPPAATAPSIFRPGSTGPRTGSSTSIRSRKC